MVHHRPPRSKWRPRLRRHVQRRAVSALPVATTAIVVRAAASVVDSVDRVAATVTHPAKRAKVVSVVSVVVVAAAVIASAVVAVKVAATVAAMATVTHRVTAIASRSATAVAAVVAHSRNLVCRRSRATRALNHRPLRPMQAATAMARQPMGRRSCANRAAKANSVVHAVAVAAVGAVVRVLVATRLALRTAAVKTVALRLHMASFSCSLPQAVRLRVK